MVVLPQPGGPHRIIDASRWLEIIRPTGPEGFSRWSCPTTSARVFGRSRSASGRGADAEKRVIPRAYPATVEVST